MNTAAYENQTAHQAKINSDIAASTGLANLGDSQARANAVNYTMLSQAGAGQQSQAQDQINAQMAKYSQANSYPQQQLATLLSSLGMTPHDTSSTGSSTSETTTPTNWGALALGGLEDLSGFFKASDKSLKTDITKLGKDPKTGLDMHAFRYKGDPKTYPKVVGPMAQDVEKKYPGATKRASAGELAVHPAIMPTSPVRGHADGTSFVALDMDDVDLGSQMEDPSSGGLFAGTDDSGTPSKPAHGLSNALAGGDRTPGMLQAPRGVSARSQGFFVSGFCQRHRRAVKPAMPKIPGALAPTDTIPAMLSPGEAVLNQKAATKLGRGTIAQLNSGAPPSSPLVAQGIKPMLQPRTLASFMPPKKTFTGFGGGTPTGRIRLRGAHA